MPTERDVYFFDLRGYLHLSGALTTDEVGELNACLDSIPINDFSIGGRGTQLQVARGSTRNSHTEPSSSPPPPGSG